MAITKITKKIDPIYLHDLLLMKLEALYDIENELVSALPKMAKMATDEGLAAAFTEHLGETKGHVQRLEEAFDVLDKKPKKLKCEAIRGLVEDAEWVTKNVDDFKARDAAMIGAAQYVEHYEMAGYMVAVEWARMLGFNDIAKLLQENLDEEMAAAEKMTALGAEGIYAGAMGDDTEESDSMSMDK